MTVDYKDTIALPETDFPMRAGLPKAEPVMLKRWEDQGLWQKQREQSKGNEKFVLHDGPPYANGHLHIGHALNKILKDIIVRSQQFMGKDSLYVPGWDCHGLPIEWKIEEQYREKGLDKDEVDINEFRKQCREFAGEWINTQREEFKRLGVFGDWDNYYNTMSFKAEAQIARELGKFLMNGSLYKGSKPVMWSVVEKTALAEAEVEYKEHKSTTIFVRFPIKKAGEPALEDASIVIWTTTPWTIPANRGIAFGPHINYSLYEVVEAEEGSATEVGQKIVVADAMAEDVQGRFKVAEWKHLQSVSAESLEATICHHPFHDAGYPYDVPVLAAEFVTTEQGSGFVHCAPGHGADDYELLTIKHGMPIPDTVAEDGTYYPSVPIFAGESTYTSDGKTGTANGAVMRELAMRKCLMAKENIRHSYPHSWRSKAPLIFRNTPQWFVSMETNDLREKALKAIDDTSFFPETGRNRLHSMIANRPDWCVSRQRAWGVPLPIFVSKQTGEPLRDQEVLDRIFAAYEEEGADAWFSRDPQEFLGNQYNADDFEQVKDVVDVWFDSGSTHAFVLEGRDELKWPADLYLEGSDQHRGWFHSSLLVGCGTRDRAPYDAVLTHGFVLDEKGMKMSKSLGNVTTPQEVNDQYGADILRLWVVSEDYTMDLRIGKGTLKQLADYYRRFRNTFRWLLGNMAHYDASKRVAVEDMPELERWVLHRLQELDILVREACNKYDFHKMYRALHDFCAIDLSSFYFDIRKDNLYCDASDDPKRLAALTVLDEIFNRLAVWMAPILTFTTEEAWLERYGDSMENSVHLQQFPETPVSWNDADLAAKWAKIRDVRRVILGALEIERAEKRIGSSLQAAPVVTVSEEIATILSDVDMAEVSITSDITIETGDVSADAFKLDDVEGVGVVAKEAEGGKCERCWKVLPEITEEHIICNRCDEATSHLAAAE
ncbi:isoleucine--tRNA ligase [Curvivirga aplysinae]|uniref:isoleucine--tRNA ligase n=1 Tax=Curvivirga aplysinae TaxID=2529852 RepID=UPI0012BBC61C|nr:isoleucine--tRNA ligase [Curvivirga aplysinae]MTI11079.1 isoleucine--tRNA ligase [Curvivirga aplysinae]